MGFGFCEEGEGVTVTWGALRVSETLLGVLVESGGDAFEMELAEAAAGGGG